MNTTVQKIERILTSEYTIENYLTLVQEILDSIKIVAPNNLRKECSNFISHIEGYSHIGDYTSPDAKKIAVFAVKLKNKTFVDRARSKQRNFAKKLIESGNCDAALVAFYTEGNPKWRFSFVRLDYEMTIESGNLKAAENLTPAKRYSYLVGKDEPCHTAIDRFRQFIVVSNSNPTLDELEEAFSVEKVTKEFFELYCDKFHQLREHLESNDDFVDEAKRCGFTSEQFAKKLMGQTVFLYFLQKKGWLGVSVWPQQLTEKEYKDVFFIGGAQGRIIKIHLPMIYLVQQDGSYRLNSKALDTIPNDEEEVIANNMLQSKRWGDGSQKFLRTLFEYAKAHKQRFYENYLEPLFYDTLNRNRGTLAYCPALHCRIPFLSGGLFEPLDGYDWKSNNFDIPDTIFSNRKDENDRNANGILDVFDRYNFTMCEDEPMEREVAIDPEMLGKVFENLLEVKDRKSKGAFYTPREIVHFMCQESLINYLVRKTGISESATRDFILYGDFMKDEDTVKDKRQGNGGMFISEEIYKIGTDGAVEVNRLNDIDEALASVSVADPAVGSGAFPLGMMNEIVKARATISAYLTITMKLIDIRYMYRNERSPYMLKLHAIKNSIFAVDIEPSAVDIAQLRLWLSLVIDDEVTLDAKNELEGHRNPLPLPNLECNILCGNSLVDEFKGVKLVNTSDILQTSRIGDQLSMTQSTFDTILRQLLAAQDALFKCDDPNKKGQIKQQIQSYKDMIINNQLHGSSQETIAEYNDVKNLASKPFILWELDFARVFRDNNGFDIVIGNPPYVDSMNMVRNIPNLRDFYTKKFVSATGNWDMFVLFIELGYCLSSTYGSMSLIVPNKLLAADYANAIRTIMARNSIIKIRDYSNIRVFKEAAVYPITFLSSKTRSNAEVSMVVMESLHKIAWENTIPAGIFYETNKWDRFLAQNNEAHKLIDRVIRKCVPLESLASVNGAATVSEAYEIKNIIIDKKDCSLDTYFMFMNTGTIDPYVTNWGINKTQYIKQGYKYPAVSKSDVRLKFPKRYSEASSEKIVVGGMTKVLECYYDNGYTLAGKSTTIIYNSKVPLKYLLVLLNSKFMSRFYGIYFNSLSLAGGFYRIGAPQIRQLPIMVGTEQQMEKAIILANKLIEKHDDIARDKADALVYDIYGLSNEEIFALNA